MTPQRFRYLEACRRSCVTRTVLAGAILVLPMACGNGDEAAFSTASSAASSAIAGPATTGSSTTSTAPGSITSTPAVSSTAAPTTAAPTTASTVAQPSVGSVFPAGGELQVSFSYVPTAAQSKRPYIAVWVEDTDGNLVETISIWYEQGGKGTKYLSDLRRWYNSSGATDVTMSGATRVAGSYTVAWDGTDANGAKVAQGNYVLNIEAAREHGPSSFTSTTITVDAAGFTVPLSDDGELSAISAALVV